MKWNLSLSLHLKMQKVVLLFAFFVFTSLSIAQDTLNDKPELVEVKKLSDSIMMIKYDKPIAAENLEEELENKMKSLFNEGKYYYLNIGSDPYFNDFSGSSPDIFNNGIHFRFYRVTKYTTPKFPTSKPVLLKLENLDDPQYPVVLKIKIVKALKLNTATYYDVGGGYIEVSIIIEDVTLCTTCEIEEGDGNLFNDKNKSEEKEEGESAE
jgi:hypothetical protein